MFTAGGPPSLRNGQDMHNVAALRDFGIEYGAIYCKIFLNYLG